MATVLDIFPGNVSVEVGATDERPIRFVFEDGQSGETARINFTPDALADFITKITVLAESQQTSS